MLHYQSEYRLGRRGGCVCHSFHGYEAFITILATLFLSLLFTIVRAVVFLVTLEFRLIWLLLTAVMTIIVAILSAPFQAARWVSRRFESRPHSLKPARIAFDDLA